MAMSRKHYIEIADVIAGEAATCDDRKRDILRLVMLSLADLCKRDNPNFDRERFYAACTIDPHAEQRRFGEGI
jgi:hypothetical protein